MSDDARKFVMSREVRFVIERFVSDDGTSGMKVMCSDPAVQALVSGHWKVAEDAVDFADHASRFAKDVVSDVAYDMMNVPRPEWMATVKFEGAGPEEGKARMEEALKWIEEQSKRNVPSG